MTTRNETFMHNLTLSALLLLTASLFFPANAAYAAGDIEAGEIKAYTCMGCHGIPGYNNVYPTYEVPKVGGQHYEYLVLALHAYRDGERDHPTMQVQAQSLSDKDIEDVSAYFASLSDD
jgi:cytochrome c553